VIAAFCHARDAPEQPKGLGGRHAPTLDALLEQCPRLANDVRYEKGWALARDLLSDSETFWVMPEHPELPLTNTEADRAQRNRVIARRIERGTRTPQRLGFSGSSLRLPNRSARDLKSALTDRPSPTSVG
jgi:hypothetical protein